MDMPEDGHHSGIVNSVACAVVTVSDTRTPQTDTSGTLVRQRLEAAGHRVVGYEIIRDDSSLVRERALALSGDGMCQAILLTGGTGLAQRDTTYEAITAILDKRLDGFGELFRMLSYQEIGAGAMLSRAVAGVYRSTAVFSMPGSTAAVRLAMDKLILPQIGHLVWLLGHDSLV